MTSQGAEALFLADKKLRPTVQYLLGRNLGRIAVVARNGLNRRNSFVRHSDWIAQWEAEVTARVQTLPGQLRIIGGMPEPYSAACSAYEEAIKYWREASWALSVLNEALENPDDKIPVVQKIRRNFDTRSAIARTVLYHYRLDEWDWYPHNRDLSQRKPNQINDSLLIGVTKALETTGDTKLMGIWFLAKTSEESREEEWFNQLMLVQGNQFVQEYQAKNRLAEAA